jgi:preprotein translocase subunit YajC
LLLALVLWQSDGGTTNLLGGVLPIVAIFVVFYFLLILPNQKRQKNLQKMIAALKNGDRVITSAGIHGTIISLKDDYVVIRVPPDQVKLEVLRSTVSNIEAVPGEQA